jgi:hypothetical protein
MSGHLSSQLEPTTLPPARDLQGISDYETQWLLSYLDQARACVESFAWCTEVRDERFGVGLGGVMAVFLLEVLVKGRSREWLWVVAGDLPPAYFSLARAAEPGEALHVYCELIERWVEAVERGTLDRDVFPLGVEPTAAVAATLRAKLATVRRIVLPALCAEAEPPPVTGDVTEP